MKDLFYFWFGYEVYRVWSVSFVVYFRTLGTCYEPLKIGNFFNNFMLDLDFGTLVKKTRRFMEYVMLVLLVTD